MSFEVLGICGPGFESHAQHPRFFQFVIELWCGNDENKRENEAGIAAFFVKKSLRRSKLERLWNDNFEIKSLAWGISTSNVWQI